MSRGLSLRGGWGCAGSQSFIYSFFGLVWGIHRCLGRMVWQVVGAGVASFAAFGGAAIALEEAMNRRWVRRFGEAATTRKPVSDDSSAKP